MIEKNKTREHEHHIFFVIMIAVLALICVAALIVSALLDKQSVKPDTDIPASSEGNGGDNGSEDKKSYIFNINDETKLISDKEINAEYAMLCDLESFSVLAHAGENERIYPASMTKVMTIIVAIESVKDLSDTYTFDSYVINSLIAQGASRAGFEPGETVTIKDLLYGAALPSGGDATAGLAIYVAGSERLFAQKMNDKAAELGLKDTHFVNASGLHHDNHYTTLSDMATIFAYALRNEVFVEIMSAKSYTTGATNKHPGGITVYSTLFSRLGNVNMPDDLKVICGKTGYTDEAKYCLITLLENEATGKKYVLVTAKGSYEAFLPDGSTDGKYQPLYDIASLYSKYLR